MRPRHLPLVPEGHRRQQGHGDDGEGPAAGDEPSQRQVRFVVGCYDHRPGPPGHLHRRKLHPVPCVEERSEEHDALLVDEGGTPSFADDVLESPRELVELDTHRHQPPYHPDLGGPIDHRLQQDQP